MTSLSKFARDAFNITIFLLVFGAALAWFAILPTLGLLYLRAMP